MEAVALEVVDSEDSVEAEAVVVVPVYSARRRL